MNALTRDLVKLVETAEQSQKTREELSVSDRKFREKLHLMPPVGWLNDPNGLCQFRVSITRFSSIRRLMQKAV